MYIVSSGDGFFIQFAQVGGSPLMDTDPARATRMKKEQAKRVVEKLEEMGFVGDLVEVRIGRMPWKRIWDRRRK